MGCCDQDFIFAHGGVEVCDGAHSGFVMKNQYPVASTQQPVGCDITLGDWFFLTFGETLSFLRRENPKLYSVVESHPNVEKADIRMGHPADPSLRSG